MLVLLPINGISFLKCKSIDFGPARTHLGVAGGTHALRREDKPASLLRFNKMLGLENS